MSGRIVFRLITFDVIFIYNFVACLLMKICLFDPGIESNDGTPSANLGDLIIQEAVEREIENIFRGCQIFRVATHTLPTDQHIESARDCSFCFVGGTNLLSSKMNQWRKWRFSIRQQLKLKSPPILLGVGWQNYQEKPNLQTGLILKLTTSRKFLHSVRDNYTKQHLHSVGIRNVINTGCPTMWPLADMNSSEIPSRKSENALIMLTDYSENSVLDKKLLDLIISKYEKVFIWPQGRGDKEYINTLSINLDKPLIVLEHSFDAFQNFLASDIEFDYVGTRLHGGIKCLLSRRRALVVEIDNRAKEIAKDTNLPTADRKDLCKIANWIDSPSATKITLDVDSIEQWRTQFHGNSVKI